MTVHQADEFRALRDAIARRGQSRSTLTLVGVGLWAALLLVTLIALPFPVAATVPLLVLVATFEVIRPLHAGAERIGRYLQVFHEEPASTGRPLAAPAWERTAMVLGAAVPGAAGHPLFAPLFALATLANMLAVLLPRPVPVELVMLAIPHAAFLAWLVITDRAMRKQRSRELGHFRELRDRATPEGAHGAHEAHEGNKGH